MSKHSTDINCQLELLSHYESLNQLEAAESLCIALLKNNPQNDQLLVAAADMATRRGAAAVAEALLYRALAANPLNNAAYLALGMVHYERNEIKESELYFRKALLLSPGNREVLWHLGTLLNELGRFNEAIPLLVRAAQAYPKSTAISQSLADSLQGAGQSKQAYGLYQSVIEKEPDNVEALISLSVVCESLNLLDEAIDKLILASELTPDNPKIYLNLGGVLRGMLKIDEALSCYKKALALNPGYPAARWNICQIELLRGNYHEGFSDFDSRFHTSNPVQLPESGLPVWNGETVVGKRLLVQGEQAYGDMIQFVRYLPLLRKMGVKVVLENRLNPLDALLRSLPEIELTASGRTAEATCDFAIPLLSLPRLFGTTLQTIPDTVPYLAPSTQKINYWRSRLNQNGHLKVGLCWAGRKFPDARRTIPATAFCALASITGVCWYSLQINEERNTLELPPLDPLIDLTSSIQDFEDTAALVNNLDLVISIDSAVAHLAGSLAVPTWLLLPFSPDWRWLLERGDSPWYPTMRVFRQSQAGDWENALNRLASELDKFKSN